MTTTITSPLIIYPGIGFVSSITLPTSLVVPNTVKYNGTTFLAGNSLGTIFGIPNSSPTFTLAANETYPLNSIIILAASPSTPLTLPNNVVVQFSPVPVTTNFPLTLLGKFNGAITLPSDAIVNGPGDNAGVSTALDLYNQLGLVNPPFTYQNMPTVTFPAGVDFGANTYTVNAPVSSSLTAWEIALIVIGSILLLILIYFLLRRFKKSRKS